MSGDEVLNHRKNKFLTIGRSKGFVSQLDDLSTLSVKKNKINIFIESFFKSKINLGISFAIIVYTRLFNIFFIKHHSIFYIFYQIHMSKVHFCSFFFQYFGLILAGLLIFFFLSRLLDYL